jgi:hypothetical protein
MKKCSPLLFFGASLIALIGACSATRSSDDEAQYDPPTCLQDGEMVYLTPERCRESNEYTDSIKRAAAEAEARDPTPPLSPALLARLREERARQDADEAAQDVEENERLAQDEADEDAANDANIAAITRARPAMPGAPRGSRTSGYAMPSPSSPPSYAQCDGLMAEAKAGSMSASYKAAACVKNAAGMMGAANVDLESARSLDSHTPVFDPKKRDAPTPVGPGSHYSPTRPPFHYCPDGVSCAERAQ